MFRSLRTRLVASYVFAAILLVLVGAFGVTVFALSTYGVAARETVDAVARTTPDEVRLEVERYGSLAAAAPDIIRHIARPGLHISVFSVDKDGTRRFLARGESDGSDRAVEVVTAKDLGPAPSTGPSLVYRMEGRAPSGARPPGSPAGPPPRDRMAPFPLGLNTFLRLEPRYVDVPGGRINIFPIPTQLERFVRSFWIAMLPIGLFVTLAAWFMGRFITGQALRPMVETTEALNRFASGDFTPREIVTSDRSEIGELVTAYNGAAAQVSAAFEERRNVELQMRQFVADAGHELRTPLTVVMGFIDVLRRRTVADPTTSARIYDTMLTESRRMRALIDKLIALARLENPQRRETAPVDVADVAERVVTAMQALQTKPRITLAAEHGVIIDGDAHELHEVIANLVENALKYAPLSPVEVAVRNEAGQAVVEVVDRGPGLSEEERGRVFDRFYRGENRGDAEGSGLGLAIVKRAVERAGGEVSLESGPGQGCRFTIRLPRESRGDGTKIAV
jgi:two-component system OmpR family sensor kinase